MVGLNEISAIGTLAAGLAALVSAVFSWQSAAKADRAVENSLKADKRILWKDIQVLAAKAKAIKSAAQVVSDELKGAYNTLAFFTGSSGGSRQVMYLQEIENKTRAIEQEAKNCETIAAAHIRLADLEFDNASDCLARMEANVITMNSTLELLRAELSSLEVQINQHRGVSIQQACK